VKVVPIAVGAAALCAAGLGALVATVDSSSVFDICTTDWRTSGGDRAHEAYLLALLFSAMGLAVLLIAGVVGGVSSRAVVLALFGFAVALMASVVLLAVGGAAFSRHRDIAPYDDFCRGSATDERFSLGYLYWFWSPAIAGMLAAAALAHRRIARR
jgi:hypothetical protein